MYSARQRELRERRTHAANEESYWLSDRVAAIEIEEGLDFESPTSWGVRVPDRASAA
jgi:hypothetical protein